jgi:hypothetical protein
MMRKFLTWLISIIVVVLFIIGLMAYYWEYSDGFRVGQVIKLSRKGYILKTWEGQLDQGFLAPADDPTASSGVATRIWDFSVHGKDELARKQIDTAISGGFKVKVYYKEKLWRFSFWGDTKYFVYKVEKIGN